MGWDHRFVGLLDFFRLFAFFLAIHKGQCLGCGYWSHIVVVLVGLDRRLRLDARTSGLHKFVDYLDPPSRIEARASTASMACPPDASETTWLAIGNLNHIQSLDF
jgi:hypothetical protein